VGGYFFVLLICVYYLVQLMFFFLRLRVFLSRTRNFLYLRQENVVDNILTLTNTNLIMARCKLYDF